GRTAEPSGDKRRGRRAAAAEGLQFVVQKHHARRLHYDFRLELDGTLKSWAIPKGPSLDPKAKRLAVHVEDHPLDYADFEGSIPNGQCGGGEVIVWDRGVWEPADGDPRAALEAGKLKFHLLGQKLSGGWALVRTRLPGSGGKEQWLLIKENDEAAHPEAEFDIVAARPESVLSNARTASARTSPAGKEKGKPKQRARAAATQPEGAKKASLPAHLAPQLATLVDQPPPGEWRYELKFDGYRLLARVDGKNVQLHTRNGNDWTDKLASLAQSVGGVDLRSGWLDGEIVVLDANGLPDFQALQN